MVAARKPTVPTPPPRQAEPILFASPVVKDWFQHYWQKLNLPAYELSRVAVTQDRREYMRWPGERLHALLLGCSCCLPAPPPGASVRVPNPNNPLLAQRVSLFDV